MLVTFVPDIIVVFSYSGSIASTSTVIILPNLFYWKMDLSQNDKTGLIEGKSSKQIWYEGLKFIC